MGKRTPARWARDLSDTQDLVQDTVLRALKHVKTFQPQHDGALQAYLRQAVANRIRDELRRAHRQPGKEELQDDVPNNAASPLALETGEEMVQRYGPPWRSCAPKTARRLWPVSNWAKAMKPSPRLWGNPVSTPLGWPCNEHW